MGRVSLEEQLAGAASMPGEEFALLQPTVS